jgi:RNA polymerase subunit RPABC4/transcription elongation factor Spt4
MARCRECNLIVNAAAEYCPRCGTPMPARFRISGRGIFIVVVVLIISAVVLRNGGRGETAPTKALAASVSSPFQVAIEASASGDARPTATGTTNLPDGTQLMIWLQKPWLPDGKERMAAGLTACGDDDCFSLQTYTKLPNAHGFGVVVKNGRFSDGPFDYKGAAPRPGNYVLVVSSFFASLQPPEVRAVIGELGENMTGPLVGGCCFGSHKDQAEIQKELDEQRRAAPVVGASIYYARYVEIGRRATSAQPMALPEKSKLAKWQNVPYPNMYDSTRLAFDANSITVTEDEKGNVNGADVTARVVAGDVSIVGKYMVLSFDCASHYRINHSYPLALSSPTQESFIGNIACGAARCEILRRQEGKPVCNAAAN